MKTKIYTVGNLDCAHCAAKAEAQIRQVPGVHAADIAFATRQLHLTAEDPDALLPQVLAAARQAEPDITIGSAPHREHDHEGCACGHDHHHDHEGCACGHHHEHRHAPKNHNLRNLLLGGALFAAGLILSTLHIPYIPLGIFLAAYLLLGHQVLLKAGQNLVRGHVLDEHFLMSVATLGAFFIAEFPEAVGVMLFYRIGEYFEEKAVARSRKQIMDAVDLRPEVVTLATGETVPAHQARPGDELLIRPGDRIPLDGTVVRGESRIDTAPITGEPVPRRVAPGDAVTSGCVNISGQLILRADKPLGESMVTRILRSVENAAASKPRFERFITRFARIYTPIVVALAAAVAIIPSIVTGQWNYWVYTALSFLVMSCPCALVLSVPLAFFSGIGAGSRKGILFKGGAAIEALATVKAVVMDKTGTLTKGDFTVKEVMGGSEMLTLCASAEQYSTHPVAASIRVYAQKQGISLYNPEELEELSGRGIRATVCGQAILCGNEQLLEEHGIAVPPLPVAPGTRVLVAMEGRFAGYIDIADTIKTDAAPAVARLHSRQITTAMLTGDNPQTAKRIAEQVGIRRVWARLLPDEKLEQLRILRRKMGPTLFVGDGLNDAPVLAGADVGAAMGSGADAAIEAADVVYLNTQVSAIPDSIAIAARTRRIAWQNVIFALAVKLLVMILGLAGHASMWAAVFADSGVAMLCVLNALRLLYREDAQNPNC